MFSIIKAQNSAKRLLEEGLYEQVAIELSEGNQRTGLWTKALAKSNGDVNKAKSLYISYRVRCIKDEMVLQHEAENEVQRLKNEGLAKVKVQDTLYKSVTPVKIMIIFFILIPVLGSLIALSLT